MTAQEILEQVYRDLLPNALGRHDLAAEVPETYLPHRLTVEADRAGDRQVEIVIG